jgi:phospholipid/cholesterol/gamma-HCH transport system substrate-binding protein
MVRRIVMRSVLRGARKNEAGSAGRPARKTRPDHGIRKPVRPATVGIVGLVVGVLVLLAAFRIDDLPLIGGGDTYQAAFRDASGLAPGNEVRVAGVKVGKVTGVDLARQGNAPYVRVTFRVRGVRLGDRTGATIRLKTVLGQKFLALTPAGTGRLHDIPLDRTASPFDVLDAVQGLAGTLDQIDTQQLAQAFTALSDAFRDTPASVKASLTGLSRLSQTIASRDGQIRELLKHARVVTAVLAERDQDFRKLIDTATQLLTEVRNRKDAIHQLLVTTTQLADQISGLVRDNRATLAPTLQRLRAVVAVLQRNKTKLEDTLTSLAPFVTAFANVVGNGRWFDSYVDGLVQGFTPGVNNNG